MKPLIGVLLNQTILQKSIRGISTFEKLKLYTQAARELDVDIVFFTTTGVRIKRNEVVGYVANQDGRLKKTTVPLPKVVHKRGLFYRKRDAQIIQKMQKRQITVFNPQVPWDKYSIHQMLAEEPLLRPHLPETVLPQKQNFSWFKNLLTDGAEVFVKPRKGSLGLGITRVWRDTKGRYHYQSRRFHKRMTLQGAWSLVRKRKYRHVLQKGIPLMEDKGHRIDFRVPVQKDGNNRWSVAGIAAKRADRVSFLTNLAQGGSTHVGQKVLARNMGAKKSQAVIDDMIYVSTLVAQTINARCPQMVDLGLDIGVDTDGHPYLIEVNRRDLRITLQRSGQKLAFEMAYKNPIAYARYLLNQN